MVLDAHDEFFDPILFYLDRPVRLIRRGSQTSLPDSGYLLVRSNWRGELPLEAWSEVREITFLNDQRRRTTEHALALLVAGK